VVTEHNPNRSKRIGMHQFFELVGDHMDDSVWAAEILAPASRQRNNRLRQGGNQAENGTKGSGDVVFWDLAQGGAAGKRPKWQVGCPPPHREATSSTPDFGWLVTPSRSFATADLRALEEWSDVRCLFVAGDSGRRY
jgi:hypothetical protein